MIGKEFVFKIGIVGPSGVGKTSLMASILRSQEIVPGMRVVPSDKASAKRLAVLQQTLEQATQSDQHIPQAVQPTRKWITESVRIDTGVRGDGIDMAWLDYPWGERRSRA